MNRMIWLLLLFLFFPAISFGAMEEVKTYDGITCRIDYMENGERVFNDAKGYASIIQTLDDRGNVVEEYYLDIDGKSMARSSGYHGIKRVYEGTKCVELTYVDAEGRPYRMKPGYTTLRREYNANDQVEYEFYCLNGEPVKISGGYYGVHRWYDDDGRNHIVTYLGKDRQPVRIDKGYDTIKREYEDGLITYTWFYLNGVPKSIGQGQYGTLRLYKDRKLDRTVPVGADGGELFLLDAFLHETPGVVIGFAVLLVILAVLLPRRGKVVLLVCYCVFILYMTLLVRESGESRSKLELFWSYKQLFDGESMTWKVINNVLLFVPLGALLYSIKPKLLWAAPVFAVLIEVTQYVGGFGLAELDDVLGNTLGGVLGWLVLYFYCLLARWYGKRRAAAMGFDR